LGLSISIENKPNISPKDGLEAKLKVTFQVLEFQRKYFIPKGIDTWSIAPLESLGGKVLDRFPRDSDLDSLRSRAELSVKAAPWDSDILGFTIPGDWIMGSTKVTGYLTLHNKEWRSTYGDIESNIYPTTEFSDLLDVVRTNDRAKEHLVHDFLKEFPNSVDQETSKINRIYFGVGTPSKIDVDSLVGAYYSTEKDFIRDCLSTVKEVEGKPVKDSFDPYRETFIVNGLKQVPHFEEYLDELFEKHTIKKDVTGSVALFGSDKDSFRQLFDEISREILKPIAEELPNKDIILGKIRDAIVEKTTKQSRLDKLSDDS